MIKIAEKFEIDDLIEDLNIFKEEINDIKKYNRFSELEILIKFNEILKEIEESNFDEKVTLIYSVFEYIGYNLFEEIINYFKSLYPQKKSVYSNICQMINSKYQDNKIQIKNERHYEPKKDNLALIISNDDVDLLQKQLSNPVLDISKISFYFNKFLIEKIDIKGERKKKSFLLR